MGEAMISTLRLTLTTNSTDFHIFCFSKPRCNTIHTELLFHPKLKLATASTNPTFSFLASPEKKAHAFINSFFLHLDINLHFFSPGQISKNKFLYHYQVQFKIVFVYSQELL